MRYIFTLVFLVIGLFAQKVVSVEKDTITINIAKTDIGMSGYVLHKIDEKESTIIKSAVVTSFKDGVATLKVSDFSVLKNDALPKAIWNVEVGDDVVLGYGYKRALLIAPNEKLYYDITKQLKLKWVHPDIFATMLSFNAHPTPLKSDFKEFSDTMSVGVVFFFIDGKLYMTDAKSFKVLNVVDTPFKQPKDVKLPFYTRVGKIDSHWWNFGEGTDELESYSYYKKLIGE